MLVASVSLTLRPGEIVGLLGPNGAGKTTSFYLLAGIEQTESGRIILDQKDITHMSLSERSKAGLAYLAQDSSIFQGLTVEENIRCALELSNQKLEHSLEEEINAVLNKMHLTKVRDTLGKQLSGGERRRCEISRLLCCNPKYILLDEPFAGIDPISVKEAQAIISDLASSGIGVLITDHNYRELLGICTRAYFIYEGAIIIEGDEETIRAHPIVKKIYFGQ